MSDEPRHYWQTKEWQESVAADAHSYANSERRWWLRRNAFDVPYWTFPAFLGAVGLFIAGVAVLR